VSKGETSTNIKMVDLPRSCECDELDKYVEHIIPCFEKVVDIVVNAYEKSNGLGEYLEKR